MTTDSQLFYTATPPVGNGTEYTAEALASSAALLANEEARLARAGWPDALIKAVSDPFEYAAYVRGLGVIKFREARPCANLAFVRLLYWVNCNRSERRGLFPYCCPRGLEVRVSAIAWCADAPEGS